MDMRMILDESEKHGIDHKILAVVSLYLPEIKGTFEEWKEFYETIFPIEECKGETVEEIKKNLKKKFEEASKFHEEIDDYLKEHLKEIFD